MATNPVDDAKKAVATAAAVAAAKTAVASTAIALESGANSALDAVETLLFGKVGGAAEALDDERSALDRLRAQAGLEPKAVIPAIAAEDSLALARQQLEILKRERAAKSSFGESPAPEKAPAKKTI